MARTKKQDKGTAAVGIALDLEGAYKPLSIVGAEYLSGLDRGQIRATERLTEKRILQALDLFGASTGYASLEKFRFALYVYAKFLADELIMIENQRFIGSPEYKFWLISVKWKWHDGMKAMDEAERASFISACPERTGYIDTIEWRLRIRNGRAVNYVKPYESAGYSRPAFNAEKQAYNMSRVLTDEPAWQRAMMRGYERKLSLIRLAKQNISNAIRETYYASSRLKSLLNEILSNTEE